MYVCVGILLSLDTIQVGLNILVLSAHHILKSQDSHYDMHGHLKLEQVVDRLL